MTSCCALAALVPSSTPLAISGQWELLVIFLVILLLFGKRLPGVARSLGQGISSFKKGLNEPLEAAEEEAKKADPKKDLPSETK